jgi:hypothetical protein
MRENLCNFLPGNTLAGLALSYRAVSPCRSWRGAKKIPKSNGLKDIPSFFVLNLKGVACPELPHLTRSSLARIRYIRAGLLASGSS